MQDDEEHARLLSRSGSQTEPGAAAAPTPRAIQAALFTSYFMAAWAWRGMEFTIALVLIELYPKSLLLVSLYGLLDNGMTFTLGGAVGGYIDRSNRWKGARNCYIAQNICVSGAGLSLSAVLAGWVGTPGDPDTAHQLQYWALVAFALLLSSLSAVGSRGITIAVEKRMPKLLCSPPPGQEAAKNPQEPDRQLAAEAAQQLASMNSVFRAIDLTCLLASPMASGVLMTYCSPLVAVLALVAYCLLAWLPELLLLRWAVFSSPHLQDAAGQLPASFSRVASSTSHQAAAAESATDAASAPSTPPLPPTPLTPPMPSTSSPAPSTPPKQTGSGSPNSTPDAPPDSPPDSCTSGWSTYAKQPVLLANLSLALLYMTVLSLGFLMTSYLKWSGLSEAEIGAFRGVGAVTGIAATAVYPSLQRRLGAVRAGVAGVYYQLSCLLLGVVPVLWSVAALGPGQRPELWEVRLLIGGVVASRSGLWLFDLAITQEVQDRVPAHEMGVVCGVQNSVQALSETASFVAGTLLTDPSQFWVLMLGSLCIVGAAAGLYTVYALFKSKPNSRYQQLPTSEHQGG